MDSVVPYGHNNMYYDVTEHKAKFLIFK